MRSVQVTLSRGRGPVLPLERGGQRQSAGFDLRTRPISSISRLVVLCPPLACLGLASRLARGPVAPVRCQADTSTCDHARERDSLSVSALFAPVRPISERRRPGAACACPVRRAVLLRSIVPLPGNVHRRSFENVTILAPCILGAPLSRFPTRRRCRRRRGRWAAAPCRMPLRSLW